MEADDNIHIVRFTYTGEEAIPDEATHVVITVRVVLAEAFADHPNIVEVICGEDVEKIEQKAFYECSSLRRVIMPNVKEVEESAFAGCLVLTDVECGKLGIIGGFGFGCCFSLSSIDLPSIKIIDMYAFQRCRNLTNVKFGKDLESIRGGAFEGGCHSLERITLPLKDGMITAPNIFRACEKLNHIDLVEGDVHEFHEFIAALLMEEWKNDMNEEIENINQILPNTPAGDRRRWDDPGGKTRAIRRWIRSVLRKVVHYKSEHRRYLNIAAATLQPALPDDIVLENVLPFLELPSHTFEGGHLLEDEDEPPAAHELNMEEQVNRHFFGSSVALSLVFVIVPILMGAIINLVGSRGFDSYADDDEL